MALPVKKVYVDTVFKATGSRSNSDFRFELAESLTMPENAVFFVDDVCVPHSWRTVETGINDRFFAQISSVANANPVLNQSVTVTLPSKVYTGAELAAELATGLNATGPSGRPTTFAVTFDVFTNEITISPTYADTQIQVLTTSDIASQMSGQWLGAAYDPKRPQDINGEMLKQTEGTAAYHTQSAPWTSGVISLNPIRSLYLYSPNLGSFHTLGPTGEASIIKAIPVTAGPNFMIFDQVLAGNDYLDCSRQTLRTLEFQLKDVHGNTVPLHGSHLSFSLVFDIVDTGR